MAKAHYKKAIIIALVSIACIGAVWGITRIPRWLDPFEARKFDPTAWASADDVGRAAMARDAIRHLPPGTEEAAIKPLLGIGTVYETDRLTATYPSGAVRTHSYYLGCWSAHYYDSTFLWVHVGSDGRVVEAVIGGG